MNSKVSPTWRRALRFPPGQLAQLHPQVARVIVALSLALAVLLGRSANLTARAAPAAPEPTATATPTPTPTGGVTVDPRTPIEKLWQNTMTAEAGVTSVHSKGTLGNKTGKLAFIGNCAPPAYDIQLAGKDRHGHAIAVEYLTTRKGGFWSRTRRGKHPWGKWKHGPGYDADIFIQFVEILCPQSVAKALARAPLPAVDAAVRDLGTDQVGSTSVHHLRTRSRAYSDDYYVTEDTFYWLRWRHTDPKGKYFPNMWTAMYSSMNQVTISAPS